jgi:hypothetical protein
MAVALLKKIAKFMGWNISRLSFELINIREGGNGDLIRLRIPSTYLWEIRSTLQRQYPEVFQCSSNGNLDKYIEKSALNPPIYFPGCLSRSMYLIHVVANDMKLEGNADCLFLMLDHIWKKPMREYAKTLGVQIRTLKHAYPLMRPSSIQQDGGFVQLLKCHARELALTYIPRQIYQVKKIWDHIRKAYIADPAPQKGGPCKIGVFGKGAEHYENDGLFSDIFFTFQSELKKELLVLLRVRGDVKSINELKRRNIGYCCTTMTQDRPEGLNYYFGPRELPKITYEPHDESGRMSAMEKRWFKLHQVTFHYKKAYWSDLVRKENIKVFHTWQKFEADHVAITDAMRETEGVMCLWQLAFEQSPDVSRIMSADVAFGFSNTWNGEYEKIQDSRVSYHVTTGFLGTNYDLLRPEALKLRRQLQAKGAQKIVACFDENSLDDSRWHLGHELQRKHYQLLLEKMMKHSWLGLIFKPKQPRTLRKRLGDVADLLEQAEHSGRCLVLESSGLFSSNIPPTLAGLASDIAIQGHMNAGTSALECVLAGVPTLSVDLEGCRESRLYELGEGRVVFRSYEHLWDILLEHWSTPTGVPGLADWSPLLDELDPFQDARGAERMGTYLHWLIQGFNLGEKRDRILEEAAEKYCKQWGADKIMSFN